MRLAACSLAAAVLAAAADAQSPPDEKEVRALVEEIHGLDARTADGLRRQDEILARLELLPPLSEKDLAAWRKTLAKLQEDLPQLEKKSGRHFLWEEEERGLYLVGGRTKRPTGLLVAMHGGGFESGDAHEAQGTFDAAASKQGWVALYPQVLEQTSRGWTDSGTEEFVLELIERALRTFDVDRNRVFLAGHSMGGYGTWTLGARHADLVAGLAPSAGAPTAFMEGGVFVDVADGIVPNLRNVAMVVYQSDDDPQVPPGANRIAAQRVTEARERWGGYERFEYWEVPGRQHQLPPGGVPALIEKVADSVRDPRPTRIVWQPSLRWTRQSYWLWWRTPEPRAIVVADHDREARRISVTGSADAAGLKVLVGERLVDMEAELVVELNGSEVFRGVPQRSFAALVATSLRGDPDLAYEAWIPLVP